MPDVMPTGVGFEMGRVVAQTFETIQRNVVLIVLLCSISYIVETGVPYLGLFRFMDNVTIEFVQGQQIWLTTLLLFVMGLFLYPVLLSSIVYIVVEDINGRRTRLAQAVLFGLRTMIPVFVLTLLVSLGVMVGWLLLIVPGLMLLMCWFVAIPVRVIEGPGFRNALSRSAALTKGHRWKLFGLTVAYGVLTTALYWLSGALTGVSATQDTGSASFNLGAFLLAMVLSVVTSAISTVGTATVYGELRRVKEGGLPNRLATVFE